MKRVVILGAADLAAKRWMFSMPVTRTNRNMMFLVLLRNHNMR